MGSSMTLDDFQKAIEDIVKTFTNDFKLIVFRRAIETRLTKKITFALTVKKVDAKDEELFDSLSKLLVKEPGITDIKSNFFIDNNTLKEDYFITGTVGI